MTFDPFDRSGWLTCIACTEPSLDIARGLCQKCWMREFRAARRMKVRACVACQTCFSTPRRDALYCSAACRQRSYRSRVTDKHGVPDNPCLSVTQEMTTLATSHDQLDNDHAIGALYGEEKG
jgi:hypothetical protein